jgi:hypothetical protein
VRQELIRCDGGAWDVIRGLHGIGARVFYLAPGL